MSLMKRLMAQKLARPTPKPTLEQAVEQANVELGRDADALKLIDRTVALLKGAPPAAPVPTSAPRGSCKAVNAATGLQCALLAGHTKPHRHGSTEFVRLAVPGERFTRRAQLEQLATARNGSLTTGEH